MLTADECECCFLISVFEVYEQIPEEQLFLRQFADIGSTPASPRFPAAWGLHLRWPGMPLAFPKGTWQHMPISGGPGLSHSGRSLGALGLAFSSHDHRHVPQSDDQVLESTGVGGRRELAVLILPLSLQVLFASR